MSILEIHTFGQPHCVDTFLGMDMHWSFDNIVTRVGDVGAGIIGEVFSGGEEGPGSLAWYLRVGKEFGVTWSNLYLSQVSRHAKVCPVISQYLDLVQGGR